NPDNGWDNAANGRCAIRSLGADVTRWVGSCPRLHAIWQDSSSQSTYYWLDCGILSWIDSNIHVSTYATIPRNARVARTFVAEYNASDPSRAMQAHDERHGPLHLYLLTRGADRQPPGACLLCTCGRVLDHGTCQRGLSRVRKSTLLISSHVTNTYSV